MNSFRNRLSVLSSLCLFLVIAGAAQAQEEALKLATLQIRTSVQRPVNNAVSAFTLIALAKRSAIISYSVHTRLSVTVGDHQVTFTQDGKKSVRVPAADQDYQISGSSDIAFTVRSRSGQIQSMHCVLNYQGDGTLTVSPAEAGAEVPVSIVQKNSRITSIDSQSGESELEVTLRLQR